MIDRIIQYSIQHKLIVILFTLGIVGFGSYSLINIPIGAVPDITNNQVQVITTSRNLATEDVEKFLTYPVELEMANLPGVKEIRSVSKFGLSVVTIVFEEKMGAYLPRQLIAEKIKHAEEKIPEGFGKPFMGPVSTGLGEIYQYVVDVDQKYKDQYSITDLRTIQDWLIKRQLSGIPGVVEINTWGGFLKQYEVAVNPERLRAMNVSLVEVFHALEKNNNVSGGGYIEKTNQAYFIRGEGLITSVSDIEHIVVDIRNGAPLLIRDLATVGFGHATRFGAITGNGEGEKVLGQVMMLKGANSNAVIEAVKERVAAIQSSLPEGVTINGFLDRSELIGRTTSTIIENLVLGCLIVIFVVVLLLGNWRSGLVVASVIPLSLLFALAMMYLFGVDANLMSLGAIDFGIIIDGAVIIVEYIAFKISGEQSQLSTLSGGERQTLIDKITVQGASKMMNPAVFGQLIIIIVFIPVLSLTGVEGKMFIPMALVFCFALLGAMLLCFTYIPVMSSLFIRPSDTDRKTASSRIMSFLKVRYQPAIVWALRKKQLVLGLASIFLVAVVILFSRMGGEFVPTLDEGDFVIQPVLKTGTSLSKTVEATTRMEKIILQFPEVKQVVSRIGAAEVPTDPMSMEESDVIITLRPKSEWVTASSKDELADTLKAALSIIPGVDFEFTQPIEMRFNELITGVRADLAIKIFGEDLNILYDKALEIEKAIQHVEGAADIIVEKVAGLPQMTVKYDRQKIAKYGMNISELNQMISMGFAGLTAGVVFEGEKQFDLVIRFAEAQREDLENIKMASVLLPNGGKLPLSEFAEIQSSQGPAKISRDNTRRRIVVGVNVRGRDLESTVEDVQKIINEQISFPAGYSITYGGQFENLRTARERLAIAVPIALLLIFIMLYFAFNSVKDALIIYSAIPLSAIGGVLLLYIRGMPFSISAGVGFIALFGIAVLNGIVLIEEFNALKANGISNINRRILMGTRNRLRPVLLTASAAALGFLPMAISTSAGAEVQRPLATVVVGGLVSATLLTLIILPILYVLFDRKKLSKVRVNPVVVLLGAMLLVPVVGKAQAKTISLEQAITIAVDNNNKIQAAANRIRQNESLLGSAFNIDKLQLYYNYDENNIPPGEGRALRVFGLNQTFQFPTVYGAQRSVQQSRVSIAQQEYALEKRALIKEVSGAYYTIIYWQNIRNNYAFLDSLYSKFGLAASQQYAQGETTQLEHLLAISKQKEMHVLFTQSKESVNKSYLMLEKWLQTDSNYHIPDQPLTKLEITDDGLIDHPGIDYYHEVGQLAANSVSLERQKLLPDVHLTFFHGSNDTNRARGYSGIQAGIGIPLWFGEQKSRISAAKVQSMVIQNETDDYIVQMESRYEGLRSDLNKFNEAIDYYVREGESLAKAMTTQATLAFDTGEINFFQYVQLLDHAMSIEMTYLENLNQYNQTVLEATYMID